MCEVGADFQGKEVERYSSHLFEWLTSKIGTIIIKEWVKETNLKRRGCCQNEDILS